MQEAMMGFIGNVLNWVFGDDDESKKQYQDDIDYTMGITFNEEEGQTFDEFAEIGEIPNSNYGDEDDGGDDDDFDEDGGRKTPPWQDPPDDGGGGWGFIRWLLGH